MPLEQIISFVLVSLWEAKAEFIWECVIFEVYSFTLSPPSSWNGLIHLRMWTHPLLQIGFQSRMNIRMANSVDPDGMTSYEPSHLDLHCLQRYQCWSVEMKSSCIFSHWQCKTPHLFVFNLYKYLKWMPDIWEWYPEKIISCCFFYTRKLGYLS